MPGRMDKKCLEEVHQQHQGISLEHGATLNISNIN